MRWHAERSSRCCRRSSRTCAPPAGVERFDYVAGDELQVDVALTFAPEAGAPGARADEAAFRSSRSIPALYREIVRRALAEDLGWGDVTTEATVAAEPPRPRR